jgi:LL-diaminopimelate aminotransferase
VTQFADRVVNLPPYALAKASAMKEEARKAGHEILDLTIGSPDLRPPQSVIDALKEALDSPGPYHRYSPFGGLPEFRSAIATWYERRFGVSVDPATEVMPVIGSKEGLERLAMALLNKGDTALIPSPAYPAYWGAVYLVEGIPYEMPLLEENGFIPDLDAIPEDVRRRAKYLLFNYPNNPTGACETDFYERAVAFCKKYGCVCVSDIPYSDLLLDEDASARSIFQIPGARDVAIEFQSFSKNYSMAGWRVAFAAGRADLIAALGKIKANVDFSIFPAMQYAAAKALTGPQDVIDLYCRKYRERRDVVMEWTKRLGWRAFRPKAAMYVWSRIAPGYGSSEEFTRDIAMNTGVVLSPGNGFGRYGEGYFRIALVEEAAKIDAGFRRIEAWRGARPQTASPASLTAERSPRAS